MKIACGIGGVLVLAAHLCMAQGFYVGGHGAYALGGDIGESAFGFGAQGGWYMTDSLSLDLAWTRFDDTRENGLLQATLAANAIAVTLRYGFLLSDNWLPYGGGGVQYFIVSGTLATTVPEPSEEQRTQLQPIADYFGMDVDALLASQGYVPGTYETDLGLDSTVGYHLCAGAEYLATDSIQLFGEYRYTFGSLKGKTLDQDYSYGLFRLGASFLL